LWIIGAAAGPPAVRRKAIVWENAARLKDFRLWRRIIGDMDKDRALPRLEVSELSVAFSLPDGSEALAVDKISLSVAAGEILALVGESGCGKSVTCLALMRLLPTPPARLIGGSIRLAGREIQNLPNREMRKLRGSAMSMVFQEPMTSFDPVYTIGEQLAEAVAAHGWQGLPGELEARVDAALASVGLPDPAGVARRWPHELSGGMKQRAMIAMALLGNPEILFCDEPTTALDVTIQAQIMDLLLRLREERGVSMLFITHNLGLVAELANRAAVMYAGRIVEIAAAADLLEQPLHPYTVGLLASVPRLDSKVGRLASIPGNVPGLGDRPPGCKFAERCRLAAEICRESDPPLTERGGGRLAACHFAGMAAEAAK
jgi:oligopeptide/dipeptide ABC transporter ATP-binding protein